MAGQSWQQDLEVTGHIVFTGSRERERDVWELLGSLSLFLSSLGAQPVE